MGNQWILSAVLDRDHSVNTEADRSESGIVHPGSPHRELLKQFDEGSDLLSTHQEADAWRTRYRIRHLRFLKNPSGDRLSSGSVITAAACLGPQSSFMILQVSSTESSAVAAINSNTLLFYGFDSTGLPLRIGSVAIPGVGEALATISMAASEPRGSWALKIRTGDTVRLFLIETRDAFERNDTRFSVKEMSHDRFEQQPGYASVQKDYQAHHMSPDVFPKGTIMWEVIATFPVNNGVSPLHSLSSELEQEPI